MGVDDLKLADEVLLPTRAAESHPPRDGPRRRARRAEPSTWTVLAVQVLVVGGLLALWELAAEQGWIDEFFWSRPTEVVRELRAYIDTGELWTDTTFTVRSMVLGFCLGTAAGSVAGLSLWWSRLAARVVEPLVVAAHAVPKLAFAPLFIIVFGLGVQSKVAMVVALTVITTTITAHGGVKAIDQDLVTMVQSLGASRAQVFRKVIVPAAMPWIVSALRLNIGLSLTGAVVGEMIGSRAGLGRMVFHASTVYNVGRIWAGALLLAGVAIVMYALVGALERRVLGGVLHSSPVGRRR